jgi:hypothetical protein
MNPSRKTSLQPQQIRAGAMYTPGAPLLPQADCDIETRYQQASRSRSSESPYVGTSHQQVQHSRVETGQTPGFPGPELDADPQWKGVGRSVHKVDLDSAHASNCLDDVLAREPFRALQGIERANRPLPDSPKEPHSESDEMGKGQRSSPNLEEEVMEEEEDDGKAKPHLDGVTGVSRKIGEQTEAYRGSWAERPRPSEEEGSGLQDDAGVSDETQLLEGSVRCEHEIHTLYSWFAKLRDEMVFCIWGHVIQAPTSVVRSHAQ